TAEDCHERALRRIDCTADEINFLLHEIAGNCFDVGTDSDVGCMAAVRCTERIVYENVTEGSPVFAELCIVAAFLLAVKIFEACILKEKDFPVFQGTDCILELFAPRVGDEYYFF